MKEAKRNDKVISWLKIIRIQFYPMALIAYSLGASLAFMSSGKFNLPVYSAGYVILFLIELLTILCNEYFDYYTDCANKNFSPFTGGTRMLVEGKITFREVKYASLVVSVLIVVLACWLHNSAAEAAKIPVLILVLLGLIMGVGYTAPPLKFCYRGLGEFVVSTTHSPFVIMCGYIFQTGRWSDPLPWLLSVPLFFAVLGANTLAGIPDHKADFTVSKRTLPVILGPRMAASLAIIFITVAAATDMMLWYYGIITGYAGAALLLVIPHAIILWLSIYRLIRAGNFDRKINSIMQLALSYIIWFGIIPLICIIWK
ncbi:MAG: prenyltransferase [Ignavibacteriales bacterium]